MMTVEVTTRDSDAPKLYMHVHETSFVINGTIFKIKAENETDYIPVSAIKFISIVDENTLVEDILERTKTELEKGNNIAL